MATGGDLSHSLSKASEESFDAPCKFCLSRDKKQVESTHFCVDCDCKLCKACIKWHQNIPAMSTHQIVDVTMATGTSGKKGPPLPTERCEEHHRKLIDHFCLRHHKLCCVSCVATEHKDCDVEYLPSLAQGTKNCIAIKKVQTSAKPLLRELKQVKQLRCKILQKLHGEESNSQNALLDLRRKLIKRIDDLIKTESDIIKCEYQEEREAIQRDIQDIDDQLDAAETYNKRLAEYKDDNESQLFVYMKQAQENEKRGKELIQTLMQSGQTHIPKYEIRSTLEQYLRGVKNLGQFDKAVQLAFEASYNIKSMKNKYNCNISGACMLRDGSFVLADYNNTCLKQLDNSYSIIITLPIQCKPNDVCYICKTNEVAVTLTNRVQFVKVISPMEQTVSFQVDGDCSGICYSQDELFVSMNSPYSQGIVCVFSLSGQRNLTIPIVIEGCPPSIQRNYIAVSGDGRQLYVTYNGMLYIMDRTGKRLSHSIDAGLNANGVCTMHDDSLLVTNNTNNKVLHVSSNGKTLGVVLEIPGPRAVLYDSAAKRVILHTESSNVMKVFSVR